nr:unnamed protein product [Callosobruchus analis]
MDKKFMDHLELVTVHAS